MTDRKSSSPVDISQGTHNKGGGHNSDAEESFHSADEREDDGHATVTDASSNVKRPTATTLPASSLLADDSQSNASFPSSEKEQVGPQIARRSVASSSSDDGGHPNGDTITADNDDNDRPALHPDRCLGDVNDLTRNQNGAGMTNITENGQIAVTSSPYSNCAMTPPLSGLARNNDSASHDQSDPRLKRKESGVGGDVHELKAVALDEDASSGDEEVDMGRRRRDGEEDRNDDDDYEEEIYGAEEGIMSERERGDGQEAPKLDDDEDRANPAFIPKRGQFYMHDSRGVDQENSVDAVAKRLGRAEVRNRWGHDRYNENEQKPKASAELIRRYGEQQDVSAQPEAITGLELSLAERRQKERIARFVRNFLLYDIRSNVGPANGDGGGGSGVADFEGGDRPTSATFNQRQKYRGNGGARMRSNRRRQFRAPFSYRDDLTVPLGRRDDDKSTVDLDSGQRGGRSNEWGAGDRSGARLGRRVRQGYGARQSWGVQRLRDRRRTHSGGDEKQAPSRNDGGDQHQRTLNEADFPPLSGGRHRQEAQGGVRQTRHRVSPSKSQTLSAAVGDESGTQSSYRTRQFTNSSYSHREGRSPGERRAPSSREKISSETRPRGATSHRQQQQYGGQQTHGQSTQVPPRFQKRDKAEGGGDADRRSSPKEQSVQQQQQRGAKRYSAQRQQQHGGVADISGGISTSQLGVASGGPSTVVNQRRVLVPYSAGTPHGSFAPAYYDGTSVDAGAPVVPYSMGPPPIQQAMVASGYHVQQTPPPNTIAVPIAVPTVYQQQQPLPSAAPTVAANQHFPVDTGGIVFFDPQTQPVQRVPLPQREKKQIPIVAPAEAKKVDQAEMQ